MGSHADSNGEGSRSGWHRGVLTSGIVALLTGLLIGGVYRQAPDASAEAGSAPVSVCVRERPDQESGFAPGLVRSPVGQIFRVWSRPASGSRVGSVLLASSQDGLTWHMRTQLRIQAQDVNPLAGRGGQAQLAVNQAGDLAVTYLFASDSDYKDSHVRLAYSHDDGQTWTLSTSALDSSSSLSARPHK